MPIVVANGARIPALGFGTYSMQGDALSSIVSVALRAGFLHIDTAQVYANEADVGRGIAQSGVARDGIFITTKVWAPNCDPRLMGPSVDQSLRKLGSDLWTAVCCTGRTARSLWRTRLTRSTMWCAARPGTSA